MQTVVFSILCLCSAHRVASVQFLVHPLYAAHIDLGSHPTGSFGGFREHSFQSRGDILPDGFLTVKNELDGGRYERPSLVEILENLK